MSTCSSCGAQIVWTVTDYGKKMPVDAEPTGKVVALIQLGNGDVRSRVIDAHRSHFETCPNAAEHRRRRS